MRLFVRTFGVSDRTTIIDVGGNRFNWELIDCKPNVTMVNILDEEWTEGRFEMLKYDGETIPFADNTFDICYSNSVIEHVGDREKVAKFAREIRRVAPAYYVQTPNRHFFIEPHFICIFLHWLPFSMTRKLIRFFSVWGWVTKSSQERVDQVLRDIRLLTIREMQALFPDARIIRDTFLGMTKSVIAIRLPHGANSQTDEMNSG